MAVMAVIVEGHVDVTMMVVIVVAAVGWWRLESSCDCHYHCLMASE
jgi:hypothetical protein